MMSEFGEVTTQLNTRGLRCPEPVMMLHQAIRKSKSGDIVEATVKEGKMAFEVK